MILEAWKGHVVKNQRADKELSDNMIGYLYQEAGNGRLDNSILSSENPMT
jgi:hypothetical protein